MRTPGKKNAPSGSSRVADVISIGFGSGATSIAPGTFGSLGAAVTWCALQMNVLPSSSVTHVVLLVVVILVGTMAVAVSLRQLCEQDPGWIVIDEWAGMCAALVGTNPSSITQVLFAFVVFRAFDISKLGPVRAAERLPGAYGVMLDDLVAGALAWVVVQAATPMARGYGLSWGGADLW